MVSVANRPVMQHILELVRRHGFGEAVATLYTKPDIVKSYFKDGSSFGLSLRYSVEEKPLGTAGSVRFAARGTRQPLMVISGDVITDFDLGAIIDFHNANRASATLALYQVENPLEFGVVLTGADGRITGFLEKPGWGEVFSDLINTGIYVLEPEVLDLIPTDRPFDFSKDLFPMMLREGYPLYALRSSGYWCDIGNIAQYRQANSDCLSGRAIVAIPGRAVLTGCFVEEGALIGPGAVLRAPVLIGRGATVGQGAVVEAGSVIGHGSSVEREAIISGSIVWDDCVIQKRAQVRGSVVCSKCRIGYSSVIHDSSVLGQGTEVGQNSSIRRFVKLWPGKKVEDRSVVTESVVWKQGAARTLFGRRGVSGLANVDITPELSSRLAAAFASGMRSIAISVAPDGVSQMLGAAAISGAQSAGAEVLLLDNTLPPVLRYASNRLGCASIRIQAPPTRPGMVDMSYFDQTGLHISNDARRKIEAMVSREDTPRVPAKDVRAPVRSDDWSAPYVDWLMQSMNVASRLGYTPKIMVEAGPAESAVLHAVLRRLGVEHLFTGEGLLLSPATLGATGCDFGISVSPEMESFSVLGRHEGYVQPERLLAILCRGWAHLLGSKTLALPVSVPSAVRQYAEHHGARTDSVRSSPRAVLEKTPASFLYDAAAGLTLLLGLIDSLHQPLDRLVMDTPVIHYVHKSVTCPWKAKGRVMRSLASATHIERAVEGIVAEHNGARVLLLPNAEEAVYELFAEADSWEVADEISDVYADRIRALIPE